jgi:AcrR family transcriptional regulator
MAFPEVRAHSCGSLTRVPIRLAAPIEGFARQLHSNTNKIYKHFRSKQLLVEAVIDSKTCGMNRDMADCQKGAANFPERMRAVFAALRLVAGALWGGVGGVAKSGPESVITTSTRHSQMGIFFIAIAFCSQSH